MVLYLFSAALQPVASELRACPLDIAVHFLDDGILAGDIPAVGAALLQVQRRAAEIGLALNLAKCEVGLRASAGCCFERQLPVCYVAKTRRRQQGPRQFRVPWSGHWERFLRE